MGATFARVQSAGKSPEFSEWSKMSCNTGASSLARFWRILPGIQSGPEALLTSILSRSLKTPNSVMFKLFIEGKEVPGIWRILDDVFFVNTDLNCVFRISLIGFLSVNNVPFDFSAEIPKSSCFCTRRYFQKGFLFPVSRPICRNLLM